MNLGNTSILVTGGAGFIGSHIVEFLLKNGAKHVRILDNLSTGSMANIEHLFKIYQNIEFIWGDITNIETCKKACQNMTVICHQAALGSVPRSINDPYTSHNVNVNGFLNMLIAMKENGIKRIVYASSSSVYGDNKNKIKIENEIGEQLSPYAITKYVDELYGKIFTKIYGLECIGLRYFNVFGPRQNPDGAYAAVIPKFIKMLVKNEIPTINGDGSYARDFTYIDNVVFANYLALLTDNSNCFGKIFNVGTNNNVTIRELFENIVKILGKDNVPNYGPTRLGDVPYSNASIENISICLGYKPLVNFNDGLVKTVEYFKNKNY
jgi:UDP-N-acetylglucosamine 4-epimerase